VKKRNKGSRRGTALRTEPKTDVDLVDCTFENNYSSDIGSIFNRGTMKVDRCTFRNNSGNVSLMKYCLHLLCITNTIHF
jgi:hypothetical protein